MELRVLLFWKINFFTEDAMARKLSFSLSKSIEYLLNNDFVLIYKDSFYLCKEDNFYCLDNFEDSEADLDGDFYFDFEEFFEGLKHSIVDFQKFEFESCADLNYSTEFTKKIIPNLLELGFKIESKINLSIVKKENKYLVEYIGYSFLPTENKGVTKKEYEILSSACDKFEKIHQSFLESVKP